MQHEILLPSDTVPVTACPHPFTTEHRSLELPAGLSLAEMVEAVQPEPFLRRHAHVFLGDLYIQPEYWSQVRPKAGAMVSIRMVPQNSGGGGGKSPLRMVLLIAVMVVAAVISGGALAAAFPALGASFTAGGIGATLAASAVSANGSMLISAKAPRRTP